MGHFSGLDAIPSTAMTLDEVRAEARRIGCTHFTFYQYALNEAEATRPVWRFYFGVEEGGSLVVGMFAARGKRDSLTGAAEWMIFAPKESGGVIQDYQIGDRKSYAPLERI